MSRTLKVFSFMSLLLFFIIGCSSESGQFSPEEVINNALKEKKDPVAYYAEAKWTGNFEGEAMEEIVSKEWHSKDGKIRLEIQSEDGSDTVISVNDGIMFMSYDEANNEALMSDDPEFQNLNQSTPKDQAMELLEWITDTHELSSEGEEELIGRTTYHLKATAKESGQLLGDQEIWIDKETWIVLKMISKSGDSTSTINYTKIDFDANITDEIFVLDLPEDVHIEDLGDMFAAEEVTLTEAVEELGTTFYYIPEQADIEIDSLEITELDGLEIKRKELDMVYTKDGFPLFSIGVFENEEELNEDDMLPGDELVTIRDQDAYYSDMEGFRMIVWQEEGLNYSAFFENPDFTLEDFEQLVESMELAE